MLKLRRPKLAPALTTELAQRQDAVDRGQASSDPWGDFKKAEGQRAAEKQETVTGVLDHALRGKCAYCETEDASELDHHWPKEPHKRHNQERGTRTKMFQWDNLVLACHGCNGWGCKGSHMKWCADGRTMLLDPFAEGDDPLCHFTIEVDGESKLDLGWIEPREGLAPSALERALYTRKLLKLNIRDQLRRGRARTITRFLDLVDFFRELGPDHESRSGRSIRKAFAELLEPGEPYLGAIRQILRRNEHLRAELLGGMPELGPLIESWDLPPEDCSNTG